jgi:hypothetical protein
MITDSCTGEGLWEENISCDDYHVKSVDWLCIYDSGLDVCYDVNKKSN